MARFKFRFWLDADKDDELLLMEEIDHLKSQRSYTKTVRDGIRLIIDLRKGNFDVLFELFPHTRERFSASSGSGGESDDLKAIRAQLDQLAQLQLQNSSPNGLLMAAKENVGGPKPLGGGLKKIAAPTPDDDDTDLLEIKKDTSTDAGMNFIRSAFALQQ